MRVPKKIMNRVQQLCDDLAESQDTRKQNFFNKNQQKNQKVVS